MNAVSPEILRTIQELQRLPSLSGFSLGGGTNLALQYNHRISEDIDLFCPHIVRLNGFAIIQSEVAMSLPQSDILPSFPGSWRR